MDILYALHDFEAENPDELSFAAGEPIVVLERDDQYGDGWYQGRNTSGEIGLFPQSYTSISRPTDSPTITLPTVVEPPTGPLPTPPEHPVISATLIDVQNALDQLNVAPRPSSPSSHLSSHSLNPEGPPSDDEDAPVANPRAVLAAKAAANAEREAREEKERVERRRREDEEAYARARDAGIPEGLQLSDESDDEPETVPELVVSMLAKDHPKTLLLPAVQKTPSPASFIDIADSPTYAPSQPILIPAAPILPTPARVLNFDDAPVAKEVELASVPVATTPSSVYNVDPPTDEVIPPLPMQAVPVDSFVGNEEVQERPADPVLAQQPKVVTPPTTSSPSYLRPFELSAIVAGSSAAAVAATLGLRRTPVVEAPSSVVEEKRTPDAAVAPVAPILHALIKTPSQVFLPASPLVGDSASSTSEPRSTREGTPPLFNGRVARAISPDTVTPSPLQSSQSSMRETLPLTARSTGTAQTSPPASIDPIQALPFDPTTWGVDEVIEWGKAKGFDALTLSKFAEHEISGDILIEMDIAMLKEIDLVAFGKRVHIYNGIKELKARVTRSTINISPPASGYEPDSPGMASFAPYTPSSFGGSRRESESARSDDGFSNMASISRGISQPKYRMGSAESDGANASVIEEEGEYGESLTDTPPKETARLVFPGRRVAGDPLSTVRNADESDGGSILSRTNSTTQGLKSLFSGGRARKPPPKAGPSPTTGSRSSLGPNSRRGTRLFSFGPSSPGPVESPRKPLAISTARSPTEAKASSMSPKLVDEATAEMRQVQPEAITTGDLLQKIGRPDYSGWMGKRGEKYNTWKQRFFVLKGIHLYYLKSETEQKVKGFIDLSGYRILAGGDSGADGQFGFKIVHVTERTHYFSAAEQVTVRTWMKEIMKATIGRDYTAPVVSSHNVETIPLAVAQAMSPRPRPPSPTSRARVQKERYGSTNPNTLSPADAQKLMEFSTGTPVMGGPGSPKLPGSPPFERRASSIYSLGKGSSGSPSGKGRTLSRSSSDRTVAAAALAAQGSSKLDEAAVEELSEDPSDLLQWVNERLPSGTPRAKNLGKSLSSGQILVRLVEKLSDSSSGLTDEEFSKWSPNSTNTYFDTIFSVFDFLSPKVSTDDISMGDMLSGNEAQLIVLVERIKAKYS